MNESPILIHVPHSSTFIPSKEMKYFLPSDLKDELIKMTDIYTDELFSCGEDMVVFPVSRLVCDVERFRNDAEEPMFSKGMGLAYTKCSDGMPLRNVSPQKRAALVRKYYDTHHKLLTEAVKNKVNRFGYCIIIDAHSFSADPLPYETCDERPDFCIGTDSFHTSKKLEISCINILESRGYKVLLNKPFSGTLVPMEFYQSDARVQSVMIEINRRLYTTTEWNKTADFNEIKQTISEVVKGLSS